MDSTEDTSCDQTDDGESSVSDSAEHDFNNSEEDDFLDDPWHRLVECAFERCQSQFDKESLSIWRDTALIRTSLENKFLKI